MDNKVETPTHIVLIGRFVNEFEWKTIHSVPCYSLEESEKYCDRYKIYGKSIGYQTLIAKYD